METPIDSGSEPPKRRKQSKEEFLKIYPGSEREINEKIFDLYERIALIKPGSEKAKLLREVRSLVNERDKPLPPYDWGEKGYDISFHPDEIKYDKDGMRNDDEYNPKNWGGHDD